MGQTEVGSFDAMDVVMTALREGFSFAYDDDGPRCFMVLSVPPDGGTPELRRKLVAAAKEFAATIDRLADEAEA